MRKLALLLCIACAICVVFVSNITSSATTRLNQKGEFVSAATLTQDVVTQQLPLDLANLDEFRVTVKTLFYYERTITIPVGSFTIATDAEYIILETSTRHTSTNAVVTENGIGEYKYYFATDQDIVIFDRRPNTPIWYVCAVVATVAAMGIFYFIVKKQDSAPKDVSTQGQYPYRDSSH